MPNTRAEWKTFLATLPHATEEYPFGPDALVCKIGGKMFALLTEEGEPPRITLKGKPEQNEEWRIVYPQAVLPGYYMNKRHWNTVVLDGTVPDDEVREMIQVSYDLVYASLPKALRMEWESAPTES